MSDFTEQLRMSELTHKWVLERNRVLQDKIAAASPKQLPALIEELKHLRARIRHEKREVEELIEIMRND